MQTIYLIGFMGCGKSTIGKELGKRLSLAQIDTDDYIEQKYNKKISEIFQKNGEETFRTYETEALEDITMNGIISTGGGIVEKKENINIMNRKGIIFYLNTPFSEIVNRLKNDQNRPLWNKNNEEEMKALFNNRISLYSMYADYIVDTADKTAEEITTEIKTLIKRE